jgi:Sec-independent protein translocase protein TatA
MSFLNIGLPEIIFIILIAVIIFGPENMVKSAKEAGSFMRKVVKSPYWQEIWATKRDLEELPKMLAKEAQLDETIQMLNQDSKNISGQVNYALSDLMKEINDPATNKIGSGITSNRILPPSEPPDKTGNDKI